MNAIKPLILLVVSTLACSLFAQQPSSVQPAGLSADVRSDAVLVAMKKVADWQLTQAPRHPTDDWTFGALYAGMMALTDVAEGTVLTMPR